MSNIYLVLSLLIFAAWLLLLVVSVIKNLETLRAFTMLLLLPIVAGFFLGASGIENYIITFADAYLEGTITGMIMAGIMLSFIHTRLNTAFTGSIYGISAFFVLRFLTVSIVAS